MDIDTFVKETKIRNKEIYLNYVLNEDLSDSYYFEITPINIVCSLYPEALGKLHRHRFYSILWIFDGKGMITIDSVDYPIQKGRLFFLNTEQLYKHGKFIDVSGIFISFSSKFFNLIPSRLAEHIKYEIFSRLGKCMYCDSEETSNHILKKILEEMENEMKNINNLWHPYIMATYFSNFILQAERHCIWSQNVQRNIEKKSHRTFLDFIALVDKEFQQKKDVHWYAKELGISVVLLSRYVKTYDLTPNHTMTPLKIINHKIMIEAKNLLKYSNKSISQIADILGFTDSSNFAKFFKKCDGCTPTQYRNRCYDNSEIELS